MTNLQTKETHFDHHKQCIKLFSDEKKRKIGQLLHFPGIFYKEMLTVFVKMRNIFMKKNDGVLQNLKPYQVHPPFSK